MHFKVHLSNWTTNRFGICGYASFCSAGHIYHQSLEVMVD